MDRDYIIRVLITGRDMLSSTARDAANNVRQSLNSIDTNGFKSAMRDMDNSARTTFASIRQRFAGVFQDTNDSNGFRNRFRGIVSDISSGWTRIKNDFIAGTQTTGRALTDWEQAIRARARGVDRVFFDIGRNIEQSMVRATDSLFSFNRIIAIVGAAITVLIPAITALGGALAAVASTAIAAGVALGGAFLSGIAQALPVIGLFYASIQRVTDVMKLVQQHGQIQQNAGQQAAAVAQATNSLKNAEYSLAQAHYSVQLAEQAVTDSAKNLAAAREQAARQIVDAINAEKDATLARKDAELALLEAKQQLQQQEQQARQQQSQIAGMQQTLASDRQALAQAQASGDPNAIAAAQAQIAIASQNLQSAQDAFSGTQADIQRRRAELAVQSAQQRLVESKIAEKRAIEDANKARQQGIDQNPAVIQAERAQVAAAHSLANAQHDLAQQERNVAQQRKNLALQQAGGTAQQQLDKALAGLSPAERALYNAMLRFEKQWEEFSKEITGGIIASFAKAISRVTSMIKDPRIEQAFSGLGDAIGRGLDRLSAGLTGPGGRSFFEFIAGEARKNFPIFIDQLIQLGRLFAEIARAAAPLFHELGVQLDNWLRRLANDPTLEGRMRHFFDNSLKYIDGIVHFTGALTHLIAAVVSAAAGSGLEAFSSATQLLDRATRWVKDHPDEVRRWFERAIDAAGNLLRLLGKIVAILSSGTSFDFLSGLISIIERDVLPILADVVKGFQFMAKLVDEIGEALNATGLVNGFTQWAAALVIMAKVVPGLAPLMRTLVGGAVRTIIPGGGTFFQKSAEATRIGSAVGGAVAEANVPLIGALEANTIAVEANTAEKGITGVTKGGVVLPSGVKGVEEAAPVVGGAVGAAEGAAGGVGFAGLEGGLSATGIGIIVAAVIAAAAGMFLAIKNNFLGVRTALVNALKDVGGAFGDVWQQLKDVWRTLSGKGGLGDAFHELWTVLRELWKAIGPLVKIILELLGTAVIGALILALKFLAKIIEFGVVDPLKLLNGALKLLGNIISDMEHPVRALKDLLHDLRDAFESLWKHVKKIIDDILGFVHHPLRTVKNAGESIGKKIVGYLDPRNYIPGIPGIGFPATGGAVGQTSIPMGRGGPMGTDTVPAWLTPGEWVLNARQQGKVASAMGASVRDVASFLFSPMTSSSTGGFAMGGKARRPSDKAKRRRQDGHVYAYDTDQFGNTITFIELKDGVWEQVAVTQAGKPLSKPRFTPAAAYVRSAVRQAYDALVQGGDYALANYIANRYDIGSDYRDPGGMIAPGATSGVAIGAYAAGGIVASSPGQSVREGNSVHLGGLHITGTGNNVDDATYVLRKAGLIVEMMT